MPNWVRNNVEFGNKQVINDLINEHGEFDFNKIIPMPEILEDENKDKFDKMTQEERLLFLKDNDDCADWYSWRIHFWGCKWNASETVVHHENFVSFDTPWSMPEEVYVAISKKYQTTVRVEFADEVIAENSGVAVYENGKLVEYEQGDEDFCDKIWGWSDKEEMEGGNM